MRTPTLASKTHPRTRAPMMPMWANGSQYSTNTKETRVTRKGHQEGHPSTIIKNPTSTSILVRWMAKCGTMGPFLAQWNLFSIKSRLHLHPTRQIEPQTDISGHKCLSVNEHHRGHALFPFPTLVMEFPIATQGVLPSLDEVAFKLIIWSLMTIELCIKYRDQDPVELLKYGFWELHHNDLSALLRLNVFRELCQPVEIWFSDYHTRMVVPNSPCIGRLGMHGDMPHGQTLL